MPAVCVALLLAALCAERRNGKKRTLVCDAPALSIDKTKLPKGENCFSRLASKFSTRENSFLTWAERITNVYTWHNLVLGNKKARFKCERALGYSVMEFTFSQ